MHADVLASPGALTAMAYRCRLMSHAWALCAGATGRKRFAAGRLVDAQPADNHDVSAQGEDCEAAQGHLADDDPSTWHAPEQQQHGQHQHFAQRAEALQAIRSSLGSGAKDVVAMLRLLSFELFSPVHVQGFLVSLARHDSACSPQLCTCAQYSIALPFAMHTCACCSDGT